MNQYHIKKLKIYRQLLIIGIVVLLALFLRLYKISEYMTFLGDEGRDVLVVKRMIVDHKFTLLGPTASVGGFFMGPVYYYLMLPFLWIWRLDPVGPAVMVALFGTATVYLIYIFGTQIFGFYSGIISAFIYALSPLVIKYSKSSWNPNIVPFFSLLLFYFLHKSVSESTRRYLLFIGIILGIGIQLHYVFLFLYLTTIIWFFINRMKYKLFSIRSLLAVLTGWLIGLSFFILFEVRHNFVNTIGIIKFITGGKETGLSFMVFVRNTVDVFSRMSGRLILNMPDYSRMLQLEPVARLTWYISAFSLSVFFQTWLIIKYRQEKASKKFSPDSQFIGIKLLMLLYITVPFLFGFYKKEIHDYYLGIVFAVPFIVFGGIVRDIKNHFGKVVSLSAAGIIASYFAFNSPIISAPNNQLQQVKNIAETSYNLTNGKPFNFALITDGNSDHAYRFFFEIWGNPPVTIENIQNDPDRLTVTAQLIVICETINCNPLGHPLWEIAGFGRSEITEFREVPFVKIYKLEHYEER